MPRSRRKLIRPFEGARKPSCPREADVVAALGIHPTLRRGNARCARPPAKWPTLLVASTSTNDQRSDFQLVDTQLTRLRTGVCGTPAAREVTQSKNSSAGTPRRATIPIRCALCRRSGFTGVSLTACHASSICQSPRNYTRSTLTISSPMRTIARAQRGQSENASRPGVYHLSRETTGASQLRAKETKQNACIIARAKG